MLADYPQATGGSAADLEVSIAGSISAIDGQDWDRLNVAASPFLSHAFLSQLEERRLVGSGSGWRPCHATARANGDLLAAMPMYAKTNSFGEFVFDWVWAEAFRRWRRRYFPKLVVAVPFTPVPGQRLLAQSEAHLTAALPALLKYFEGTLAAGPYSSMHVLFPLSAEIELLARHGFLRRLDCRFLWRNLEFKDFDHFLEIFNARQRKNIRRERRKVRESGVTFKWLRADELDAESWSQVHAICASTFLLRGQRPYLDAGFFVGLAERIPEQLLVNVALLKGDIVAAAIFFKDQRCLYGRYWGSTVDIDCLHFECCYYQGIDYAIAAGLEIFDPGTQGEHKLRRGFAPVQSWSLHRFAESQIERAIAAWLTRESQVVAEYIRKTRNEMPFTDPFEDDKNFL
ncbi:MAG: GNAT family N-acetyltransferase [Gammaproteobacteria bacterium]|nr:GNAT family N-acetyltransferase [Gammaproteobacteria bacterium]